MSKSDGPCSSGGNGHGCNAELLPAAQAMMLESDGLVGTSRLDFDEWSMFLRSSCGNHPDVIDPSAFAGWVRPLSVCGLAAAALKIECGSTAEDFGRDAYRSERTQRDARLAGADYYYAVFQVAGRSTLTQNEEVAQLAVGDVALLDAAQPAACSAGDAQWLRVQLPRQSLVAHLGCEPQGGSYAHGGKPAASLLFDLVRDADKADEPASSPADSYMQLAVYDLLGALFAPSDPLPVSRHADRLFARVRGVIKRGLCRSGFRPSRCRSRNGDLVALPPEAVHGARFDLQRVYLFASSGSRRAPSAPPGVTGSKPAAERDRLRLRLSRLHAFRAQISPSVRLFAGRGGAGHGFATS